ncbi:hypothetical protein FJY93_01525 [Candidatus Kaiserbacteria bacterium]|nr:hypothetical protein [Candidatus Kaiserbacteria bacterium]
MFEEKIIDPFLIVDPTKVGDGVLTTGDPKPFAASALILAAILIGILILFFRRMWELHENVLKSSVRMSRPDTRKAVGSAAYSLAERAKVLSEQETGASTKAVFLEAYDKLHEFGVRRTPQKIEIPRMIQEIMDISLRIPRPAPMKKVEKSQHFLGCLNVFAALVHDATANLDEQHAVDTYMDRCVQTAHREHVTVAEEAIIKVVEKNYLRLLEAKNRYIAAGPRTKKVKRADTDPPPKASAFLELLDVITKTEDAIRALPAKVDVQDRTQIELFRKDLREWIEISVSLIYAPWWNVEAQTWFLFGFLGRLGTALFVGSKN